MPYHIHGGIQCSSTYTDPSCAGRGPHSECKAIQGGWYCAHVPLPEGPEATEEGESQESKE